MIILSALGAMLIPLSEVSLGRFRHAVFSREWALFWWELCITIPAHPSKGLRVNLIIKFVPGVGHFTMLCRTPNISHRKSSQI